MTNTWTKAWTWSAYVRVGRAVLAGVFRSSHPRTWREWRDKRKEQLPGSRSLCMLPTYAENVRFAKISTRDGRL